MTYFILRSVRRTRLDGRKMRLQPVRPPLADSFTGSQDEDSPLVLSMTYLMLSSAHFETPPAAAPQDRRARLEARTAAALVSQRRSIS